MSKNLIPQIAEMLGVELGEEFKIKGSPDWVLFHFEECGLKARSTNGKVDLSGGVDGTLFERLLGGYLEIVKLPWKPKFGDAYYTFTFTRGKWSVGVDWWENKPHCYALLDKGWIFRTCAEAEAALPAVAKEIGVEYSI